MRMWEDELENALFVWFNSYEDGSHWDKKDRQLAMGRFVRALREVIREEIKESKTKH